MSIFRRMLAGVLDQVPESFRQPLFITADGRLPFDRQRPAGPEGMHLLPVPLKHFPEIALLIIKFMIPGNLFLDKKIGVIGLGRIGRLVAELFRGLNNPVIGYDPYADRAWAEQNGVEIKSFKEVIEESDILTLHIPGNKDKSPVITAEELSWMKDGAFLINIARGGVVDEEALFAALKSGRLTGAAVDVYTKEPYDGPLCDLDNIILTPHLGSYAKEGKLKMEGDACQNLIDALK